MPEIEKVVEHNAAQVSGQFGFSRSKSVNEQATSMAFEDLINTVTLRQNGDGYSLFDPRTGTPMVDPKTNRPYIIDAADLYGE